MHDSEDYHTGRAAAYYTVAGLLRAGWKLPELRDFCERQQLAAEDEANARSAAERRADQPVEQAGRSIEHLDGEAAGV